MTGKRVRLTITATQFVSCEADLNRQPESRTLVLTGTTFQKAIGLAETRKGFRAPRLQFLPRQTRDFAVALKAAMSEKVEAGGPRASSRFTPLGQLREYFEQPAQKRALAKLLAFLDQGGTIDVCAA